MSTHLYTVIFDNRLVTQEQVAEGILQYSKDIVTRFYKENNEEIPDQIPSILGCWALEITKPFRNMQMIWNRTYDRHSSPMLDIDNLAFNLSKIFPNIPFIYLCYNGTFSTGGCSVALNGKIIEETEPKEGDSANNIDTIFNKYFGIRRNAYKKIDKWFEKIYNHGQYNLISYSKLRFAVNHEKDINPKVRTIDLRIYDAIHRIEQLKKETDMSFEEIKRLVEKEVKIGWLFINIYYKDYLYLQRNKYTSNMYLLTEGSLSKKEPVYFREEPLKIDPLTWYSLKKGVEDKTNNI